MSLKLVECPRDAMQGLKTFIDTDSKVAYINSLLEVGFDTIDVGSFVSPKAIPQMADTKEVLQRINFQDSYSELLTIVANKRGAEDAATFDQVSYLGYPFSISETFQQRNTNASIEESLSRVDEIQNLAVKNNKTLVVYISMAFGNPYGDAWSPELVTEWSEKLAKQLGIKVIALSDTIGTSEPKIISDLFSHVVKELPNVEIGAHLHSTPQTVVEKVEAAYLAGCRRFDGAIKGFGGCPMAKDDLTGNMDTELMLNYFFKNKIETGLNTEAFYEACDIALNTFPSELIH